MIQRLKVELWWLVLAATHFQIGFVVGTDGSIGMREIGASGLQLCNLLVEFIVIALDSVLFLTELPAFFLPRLTLLGVFGFADALRDFVRCRSAEN